MSGSRKRTKLYDNEPYEESSSEEWMSDGDVPPLNEDTRILERYWKSSSGSDNSPNEEGVIDESIDNSTDSDRDDFVFSELPVSRLVWESPPPADIKKCDF